jgi:hypothetical protein
MKTNKKKSSTMKKLLPAFAMLTVSAISLSSATYAWFTMNKEVSVTSMQVKAKAEAGLLINEKKAAGDAYWDDSATALSAPGTALAPTSTTNGAKWFHANSKIASSEAGGTANGGKSANLSGVYEELSLTEANTALTEGDEGTRKAEYSIFYKNNDSTAGYSDASTDTAYYVMYKYYLRVSNDNGITGLAKTAGAQNVAIKEVKVTATDSDSNDATARSTDLNKALRVGIKMGGQMYIYSPAYGAGTASATYYAVTAIENDDANEDGVITATEQDITNAPVDAFATNRVTYTALTSLPGMTGDGAEVDVYLWFEGEDVNCKSENLTASLDNLSVDITFGLETLENAAPANTNNEF